MTNLRLVGLEKKERTVIAVGNARFGESFVIIAGPCSVESEEQMIETALAVKKAGADMLREERSNRERRPTHFRVWDLRDSRSSPKRARQRVSRLLRKCSTRGMFPGLPSLRT